MGVTSIATLVLWSLGDKHINTSGSQTEELLTYSTTWWEKNKSFLLQWTSGWVRGWVCDRINEWMKEAPIMCDTSEAPHWEICSYLILPLYVGSIYCPACYDALSASVRGLICVNSFTTTEDHTFEGDGPLSVLVVRIIPEAIGVQAPFSHSMWAFICIDYNSEELL